MNCLVTYSSKYGNTKKYAEWIAEELSCDVKPAKEVSLSLLKGYDVIIHGGGLYAGGLSGIRTITKHFDALADKTLILFSCGLADPEDPENAAHIKEGLARVLTPDMQRCIHQFHLRGGIDYGKLSPVHKAMMAMLRQSMLAKGQENLSNEDKMLLETYGKQIDFTDKASIRPLIAFVQQL